MDQIEAWREFNVAMAGATAALAGLAIVAASVNIGEIVKEKSLTSRLAAGISGLVLAILGSGVGLIPEITLSAYGVTMIVLAIAAGAFPLDAARRIYQNQDPANRMRAGKVAIVFAPPLAYVVGGVMLVSGFGGGLVAFAVGSMTAIVAAILVSWIVLVEVLR